jgi:TonB-linked SusC/RagA family outer membrane protein
LPNFSVKQEKKLLADRILLNPFNTISMKKQCTFLFLLLMLILSGRAQEQQVTGRVISSEDKEPLPGVTVVVEGTSLGTVTDAQGTYKIAPTAGSGKLSFSFIGKKTLVEKINGRTTVNVALENAAIDMNEVVVVGFGQQIKSDITGSISKVNVGDLQKGADLTFESSLQGKTPGVFIQKSTGKLGEGVKIRVRGTSSLSASNQPLYVVDGMIITSQDQGSTGNHPTNPIADLNFDDIESIQILKDASSAAIYGSRGSNGVVIITTKNGKKNQKSEISVGYSRNFSQPTRITDFLNTSEYVELIGEALENAGEADPGQGGSTILSWGGIDSLNGAPDVNWNDHIFKKAVSSNLNVTVTGGNEKNQYYAGFTYEDQQGILIANDYKRYSGRVNFNQTVNDRLDIGIKFNFVKSFLDRASNDNAYATPMQLCAQAPIFEPYIDGEPSENMFYYNGLISYKYDKNLTSVSRTFANAYANLILTKGLLFRSVFGIDNLDQREDQYRSRKTDDGSPSGEGYLRNVNVFNWSWDNYFSYEKTIGETHKLELIAGNSLQKTDRFVSRTGGKTFPSDEFQTISAAAESNDYYSAATGFSYLSWFARGNYKYANKYLAGLSYRIDGSSKFGKETRYGNFYSGALGWVISEEGFLKGSPLVSFLKLRASMGMTGNSEIGDYDAMGLYEGRSYAGKPAIYPLQLENKNLSWETTTQTDIGLDFGFFNNRLNGEIDYYYKKTTDLLLSRLLPYSSGFASITENVGKLENKGVEFTLNSTNISGKFTWQTSFNIATNQNKILEIVNPMTFGRNRVEEGQPIGVFYMKKYAGVNPDNGDALYFLKEGSDETTNNYSQAADMVVGDPNPDFYGGLENIFSYAGFDLKIFFQFVYGNDLYNEAGRFMSANGDYVDNQTKDQLKRWQKPGDITDIPQARFSESNGTRTSSRWIYDGSFLRLKDVTLGYNVPKRLTKKINIERLRLYVSGLNILTWTNFPLYDPEVSSADINMTTTSQNIQQGIWYYSTPQAKSFTFGINLTF